MDDNTQKPWALVTGASAGLGAEFCRQLAAKGYKLVLVARREERLRELADELRQKYDVDSLVITADLAQRDACEMVVKRLEQEGVEVEYLVNNAGFGLPGNFHVPGWQDHADFIQVMVTAVCELTWRLLPGMQQRKRGFIVNVASVAGLVEPVAGHTLYGASKSFLIRFSQSLALENWRDGIKVTALCPGFTYSEFHDVNGTREMISQLPDYLWLKAEDVIADCIEAMEAERVKPIVVPGRQYKAIVFMARYLPWLATKIARRNAKYFRITD
ncbi:MAG: SDR family oxidoreductase [Xanthomonadales bacterium]|nr:SDR family oxidoreductase [Xanthomonadales bacterium]